ncbi:DUF6758 family protein [Actinomadura sp. HBU206391]|uniref:DUF6758 family protein n=1 Tax=Actinomadura sp. HBU206391 TaxID=2731692 RepID=UPI0016507BD1|nr:DUF6758 family protein [Actinomadura sp. HBU206391]MBC6463364.1 hypothetical protein [Actinomadura sp. HBU206391]
MRVEPTCPRCSGPLQEPSVWSSDWHCAVHGAVLPKQPPKSPSPEGLATVARDAWVPLWLPWPLPMGWLVTGFGAVGDERTGSRACAVALSGPGLLHGPADMLLISEEPGIGFGAACAGLDGLDPGVVSDASAPHAKVEVRGHPVPLWAVDAAPDRAVYVGEAMGNWLWGVLWPAEAGVLMVEDLALIDLREPGMELDLPYGAFSPHLD